MSIDYTEVLADLRERRDKLTAAIEAIEEVLGGTAPTRAFAGAVGRQLRPDTVAGLAHQVIRDHGAPMKVGDVMRALQGMGKFKKPGRGNYGTVYGTLMDDRRFIKTGEGEFDIAERATTSEQARSDAAK